MNMQDIMNNHIFNYYVFFEKHNFDDMESPLLFGVNGKFYSNNQLHLWDEELNPVINAFWYILHLPRIALDLTEYSYREYLYCHDTPHNIITLPFFVNNSEEQKNINNYIKNPTLIICPDNIYEQIKNILQIKTSQLGVCKISELNTQMLHKHWNSLATSVINNGIASKEQLKILNNNIELLNNEDKKVIQIYQLANQYDSFDAFLEKEPEELTKNIMQTHINIMYCCQELLKENPKALEDYKAFPIKRIAPKFPIIISLPGTANLQINKYGRSPELSSIEQDVVKLISLHRSAAKNGIYIDIPLNNTMLYMFNELMRLEEHCRIATSINNKFVWRTLRRIGRLLSNLLKNKKINIIEQATSITVFSDFPIGLAILPEVNVPLCCIKPISYRPLTPLTRAFQLEMHKKPTMCLVKEEKLRILFAECVDGKDTIRSKCNSFSEFLIQNFSDSCFDFIYKETTNVESLKNFINEHKDVQILIISAHGSYDTKNNVSELIIGKEPWNAASNDFMVPPIVILSACHTSPRGRGAVVIGDLFLRSGAIAVLTSLIPINVIRNANLLVRLFTYIKEAQNNFNGLITLDQVWQNVVATNAIHEIIAGSKSIEKWANTKDQNGETPQEVFKMKRSVGQLNIKNIYNDTEKILLQMAKEAGIGKQFENYLNSQYYFPESIFYQWLGSPENVFLYNPHYTRIKEISEKGY